MKHNGEGSRPCSWNTLCFFFQNRRGKSISRVAQASHISQPALSQQMQRLEEEVGQKLFERSNRGIELTESRAGDAAVRGPVHPHLR